MRNSIILAAAVAGMTHAAVIGQVDGGETGVGYDQKWDHSWADKYDNANLEAEKDQIAAWYKNTVKPALDDHRALVTRYYLGKAEASNDQLLATCDAGTKCRQEEELRVKTAIEAEWQKVIDKFRGDFVDTIEKTETIVNEGWKAHVQCEIDNPCCTYDETTWHNIQTKIENQVKTITQKRRMVAEVTRRREEMITKCTNEGWDHPWEEWDEDAAEANAATAAAGGDV